MMLLKYLHDVRTTLTLEEDVAAKLRELCRLTGESFKSVVNRTLRRGLLARETQTPGEPFEVRSRPLGLRPGIELDDVEGVLEQIDGPRHS